MDYTNITTVPVYEVNGKEVDSKAIILTNKKNTDYVVLQFGDSLRLAVKAKDLKAAIDVTVVPDSYWR